MFDLTREEYNRDISDVLTRAVRVDQKHVTMEKRQDNQEQRINILETNTRRIVDSFNNLNQWLRRLISAHAKLERSFKERDSLPPVTESFDAGGQVVIAELEERVRKLEERLAKGPRGTNAWLIMGIALTVAIYVGLYFKSME